MATTGGTLSDNLTISKAMSNGTTAFTSPHLILAATNTIDNTGFVGMTLNTSTAANYGWSYGAQRTSGGNGDLIWRNHDSSTSGLERMRLYDSGNLDVAGTVKATNVTVGTNNVWHAGNLEFELDGTTMNIITS